MSYMMTVRRNGEMIDVIESNADDPQVAEQDIIADAMAEYGPDVEVIELRRKGATGV